ncbi:MAG: ATP-dependent Clp protease proteolytic subunit [Deltaproteobacteria bacterium]|nr:ATP-dependent Clp protease proteolytic subunit [Deltaproteobacteria bacterium]MBW2067722.1 ATP-dependent Clp protease proteolytic subunit [Deltaproteobacteria bacterium]
MNPTDLFWLFLVMISLQPLLRQRIIDATRQKAVARFESERGSRVILLVHRQETMSFLGFPIMRYIDIHDSEDVIRAIHMTDPKVPLDIIIHTPGGLVLAALQIARAIKKHPAPVSVFVPHYAMSGGTLIALAADKIYMGSHAVLGPLDPQLGKYPAPSLVKVIKEKPIEHINDETLILADMAEKAIRQLQDAIVELIEDKMGPERSREVARKLTEGHWTHDYPITPETASSLGLPVSTDMPEAVYKLMALYPQPVRRMPSVEYIPEPRTGRGSRLPDS